MVLSIVMTLVQKKSQVVFIYVILSQISLCNDIDLEWWFSRCPGWENTPRANVYFTVLYDARMRPCMMSHNDDVIYQVDLQTVRLSGWRQGKSAVIYFII